MSEKTNALILGCKQARPTGQMLAEILGWDYVEGCLAGEINKYRVIFRYGNSATFGRSNQYGGLIVNSSKAIEDASNKLKCRQILYGHEIPVPRVYDIKSMDEIEKYPVIARPFHHSQGRNFHIVDTRTKLKAILDRGYYAQDIVDKIDEFRLFILNGKIIEASKKEKVRTDANMMIRNHRKGWKFNRIRVADLPANLKRACVNAAQIMVLNWSAVDACTLPEEKACIFEVNSAPGLIPRKAQKLAEKLLAWLTNEKGIRIIGKTPAHVEDEIQEAPEPQEEPRPETRAFREYAAMMDRMAREQARMDGPIPRPRRG